MEVMAAGGGLLRQDSRSMPPDDLTRLEPEAAKGLILERLEARADAVSSGITDSIMAEVEDYAAIQDGQLRTEVLAFTREHLEAFVEMARSGSVPADAILAATRERAVTRAQQMLPLPAMIRTFMIAQHGFSSAIAAEGVLDGRLREAAMALMLLTFDYNIAVMAVLADAYLEVVQGDLGDLAVARGGLIETLLNPGSEERPELLRRAVGLGFDPDRTCVVALIVVDDPTFRTPSWRVAQAIARSSGRLEKNAFVVPRDQGVIALLDPAGPNAAAKVLGRVATTLGWSAGTVLRAGIGTPFTGLRGLASSYHEARRALRHATERRPIVHAPQDIRAFDELLVTAGESVWPLIPSTTQAAVADQVGRESIRAFFTANLNVAKAAALLGVHPNSMRYRLDRVTALTGRDPRQLTDLIELMVAIRLNELGEPAQR